MVRIAPKQEYKISTEGTSGRKSLRRPHVPYVKHTYRANITSVVYWCINVVIIAFIKDIAHNQLCSNHPQRREGEYRQFGKTLLGGNVEARPTHGTEHELEVAVVERD